MLTYDLAGAEGSLYKCLYEYMKEDIRSGKLVANEKLPSKRTFARNLGVSIITVENAYDQLMGEGYVYTLPKKGYYVADIGEIGAVKAGVIANCDIKLPKSHGTYQFDFSSNRTQSTSFPFSIWAKLMRETISMRERELLELSPCGGVYELRNAIAKHLGSFRGMSVDPDQIIVGAGTEYLYGLLVKLLGNDKIYCIETPGYMKLQQIYESNGAKCRYAKMDSQGIVIQDLKEVQADIAHISPTHHFPTGITMPVARRYELLAWASEGENRYIIEDDYDSEFRLKGKPIPSLQSIDASGRVIYMNTFSKSLTSTIRISYMVLPEQLANLFYEKLSFYNCTVSNFEQYTLAAFISQGYFEKHINRMRLQYGRKRNLILDIFTRYFAEEEGEVIENDSGLHFLIRLNTEKTDGEIKEKMLQDGYKIASVTDYEPGHEVIDQHKFIINYSNMDLEGLEEAIRKLKEIAFL